MNLKSRLRLLHPAVRSERKSVRVEKNVIEDCIKLNSFFAKPHIEKRSKNTTEDRNSLNF